MEHSILPSPIMDATWLLALGLDAVYDDRAVASFWTARGFGLGSADGGAAAEVERAGAAGAAAALAGQSRCAPYLAAGAGAGDDARARTELLSVLSRAAVPLGSPDAELFADALHKRGRLLAASFGAARREVEGGAAPAVAASAHAALAPGPGLSLPKSVEVAIRVGLGFVMTLLRAQVVSTPGIRGDVMQLLCDVLAGLRPQSLWGGAADAVLLDKSFHCVAAFLDDIVRADDVDGATKSDAVRTLLRLATATGSLSALVAVVEHIRVASFPLNIAAELAQLAGFVPSAVLGGFAGPPGGGPSGEHVLVSRVLVDWERRPPPASREPDAGSRERTAAAASDGAYLYVHGKHTGLAKMGTGKRGTVAGRVYAHNEAFHAGETGWLAVASDRLFYRSSSLGASVPFIDVDVGTLLEIGTVGECAARANPALVFGEPRARSPACGWGGEFLFVFSQLDSVQAGADSGGGGVAAGGGPADASDDDASDADVVASPSRRRPRRAFRRDTVSGSDEEHSAPSVTATAAPAFDKSVRVVLDILRPVGRELAHVRRVELVAPPPSGAPGCAVPFWFMADPFARAAVLTNGAAVSVVSLWPGLPRQAPAEGARCVAVEATFDVVLGCCTSARVGAPLSLAVSFDGANNCLWSLSSALDCAEAVRCAPPGVIPPDASVYSRLESLCKRAGVVGVDSGSAAVDAGSACAIIAASLAKIAAYHAVEDDSTNGTRRPFVVDTASLQVRVCAPTPRVHLAHAWRERGAPNSGPCASRTEDCGSAAQR